jgi:hypothetical protein
MKSSFLNIEKTPQKQPNTLEEANLNKKPPPTPASSQTSANNSNFLLAPSPITKLRKSSLQLPAMMITTATSLLYSEDETSKSTSQIKDSVAASTASHSSINWQSYFMSNSSKEKSNIVS